nr:gamma-tubulin complex component 2 [Cryptomonas paramecium]
MHFFIIFVNLRKLFSENFLFKKEKNFSFTLDFFLFMENFFLNFSNLSSALVSGNFKYKKTYKFKNLQKKIKVLAYFINIFKYQSFESVLNYLTYFLKIIHDKFSWILNKLHIGIYGGWNSMSTLYRYLFPFIIHIQTLFNFFKKINKQNVVCFHTFQFIIYLKKQTKNSIVCFFKYFLNLKFYNLLNDLTLSNKIGTYYRNFLMITPLRYKIVNKYQLIIKKKIFIYYEKILKYSLTIRFFCRYLPSAIKKNWFISYVNKRFIRNKNMVREKNVVVFMKHFFLNVLKYVSFFFQVKSFLKCIRKILFSFYYFNLDICIPIYIFSIKKKMVIFEKNKVNYKSYFFVSNGYKFDFYVIFIYFQKILKSQYILKNFPIILFRKSIIKNVPTSYILKWPMIFFITSNSKKKYHLLNKHFLKIKFTENALNCIYKFHKFISHCEFSPFVSTSSCLNYNMLSLFRYFSDYFISDVLASNWILIKKRFEAKRTKNLILFFHEKFLNKCINECHIFNPIISKTISRICILVTLFCLFIKKICLKLMHISQVDFIRYFSNGIITIRKNYIIEFCKLTEILRTHNSVQ